VAHNGSALHQGQEYFAGAAYAELPACPSSTLADLHAEASAAMGAVGASGETEGSSKLIAVTRTTVELAVANDATTTAEERAEAAAAALRAALCAKLSAPLAECTVRAVASNTSAVGADGGDASGRRRTSASVAAPALVDIIDLEVAHDPADGGSAAIDAAVNNASAIASAITHAVDGLLGVGASADPAYSSRLQLSASLPVGTQTQTMRDAVASAVAASLSVGDDGVRVEQFVAVDMPPAQIVVAATPPSPPASSSSSPSPSPSPPGGDSSVNVPTGLSSDDALPPWAVTLIIAACCICACASLGLCLQAYRQQQEMGGRKPLWPENTPAGHEARAGKSAKMVQVTKRGDRSPSGRFTAHKVDPTEAKPLTEISGGHVELATGGSGSHGGSPPRVSGMV